MVYFYALDICQSSNTCELLFWFSSHVECSVLWLGISAQMLEQLVRSADLSMWCVSWKQQQRGDCEWTGASEPGCVSSPFDHLWASYISSDWNGCNHPGFYQSQNSYTFFMFVHFPESWSLELLTLLNFSRRQKTLLRDAVSGCSLSSPWCWNSSWHCCSLTFEQLSSGLLSFLREEKWGSIEIYDSSKDLESKAAPEPRPACFFAQKRGCLTLNKPFLCIRQWPNYWMKRRSLTLRSTIKFLEFSYSD